MSVLKSFRLVNEHVKDQAMRAVCSIEATGRRPLTVQIRDKDDQRSLDQNRLYWKWMTELSDQTGDTKEIMHAHMKRMHLAKIFNRDDEDYARLCARVKNIKTEFGQNAEPYRLAARLLTEATSTRSASIKQMTEYLNDIDRWAYTQGHTLTIPNEFAYLEVRP